MKMSQVFKTVARSFAGLAFLGSGVLHFLSPEPFMRIVPSALPSPQALVYISGLFEILGGSGLLLPQPRLRQAAGRGLALLLVAVFPANVYHALAGVKLGDNAFLNSPVYHIIRLPMQAVLIWLVLWSSRPAAQSKKPG